MAEDEEEEEEIKTKEYTTYNRVEFECERDSHAFFYRLNRFNALNGTNDASHLLQSKLIF